MSIRSKNLPIGNDISLQLQDVLRKNGMQAQLAMDGDKYLLMVQGHDSPLITYPITRSQYLALVDGGTNSSNKQAYKTFVNIVHDNFDCPKDYVHARNANGKVTMGLHGYRIQDMGRAPHAFYPPHYPTGHHFPGHRMAFPPLATPPFLGWTPRQQDGYHMRRINGELVMQHGPMVPEREGGRMKPGELQSGAYGFYYKGNQQQQTAQADPLKDLQTVIQPVPIKREPAIPYKELITSPVYFTNEKWQECLESHGISIDTANKKLTIQSTALDKPTTYDLTDEQIQRLTSNKIKEVPVQTRLDILNKVIAADYQDKITMDMLNSKDWINLRPSADLQQRLDGERALEQRNDPTIIADPLMQNQQGYDNPDGVNGQQIADNKAWYRQMEHGREVSVGDVWVEKDAEHEGKYKMSAVINGEVVSHEIKEKDYNKFLALDDTHRLKMFDKVFDEVKMKTVPGMGMNFGQALMTGLAMAGATTRAAASIAHDIEHIKHPHSGPDVYVEDHHRHGRIYVKPGLDTPESIAARAFDAGMNQGFRDAVMHR